MSVFLTAHALRNGSLDVWGFNCHRRMEECCELVDFLIGRVRFHIYKVQWQWSVRTALFSVPNICDFVSFFHYCLFDVLYVRGGVEVANNYSKTSVLTWFIGMKFRVFLH